MCADCRAHGREARSSTRMEEIRAFFEKEDTLGAVVDHVVPEKHPVEEVRQMRTERTVTGSQKTLRDASAPNPG